MQGNEYKQGMPETCSVLLPASNLQANSHFGTGNVSPWKGTEEICSLSAAWLGHSWEIQPDSPGSILIQCCVHSVKFHQATHNLGQALCRSNTLALQIPGGNCLVPNWLRHACARSALLTQTYATFIPHLCHILRDLKNPSVCIHSPFPLCAKAKALFKPVCS